MNTHFHESVIRKCKIKTVYYLKVIEGKTVKVPYLLCTIHDVEVCRCGFEFGFHEVKVVINPTGICIECKTDIPKTVAWFEENGNTCKHCSAKINERVKLAIKHKVHV